MPAALDLWHPGYIVWDAVSLVPIQSAKSRDERGGIDVKLRSGIYTEEKDKQKDVTVDRRTVSFSPSKETQERKVSLEISNGRGYLSIRDWSSFLGEGRGVIRTYFDRVNSPSLNNLNGIQQFLLSFRFSRFSVLFY